MVDERRYHGARLSRGTHFLAKTVRALSVPPLMIGALLILFYFTTHIFSGVASLLLSLLFLTVIPSFAYPLALIFPKIRAKGHEGMRRLAFACSLVGYTCAMLYGGFAHVGKDLALIYLTYFLSVVILSLCNKLKFRASGHGCGVTGPLLLPAYFIHPLLLPLCAVILSVVYLSSLILKRHTVRELLAGSSVAAISFLVSLLLLSL